MNLKSACHQKSEKESDKSFIVFDANGGSAKIAP